MFRAFEEGVELLIQQLLAVAPHVQATDLGPVLAAPNDLDRYLPTVHSTTNIFSGFTSTQKQKAIQDRLDKLIADLKILDQSAQGVGVSLSILDNTGRIATQVAKMPAFGTPIPVGGLHELQNRLSLDKTSTATGSDPEELRTIRAHKLLLQANNQAVTNPVDLATICTNAPDAAALLLELRCLEDVYARFAVAIQVFAETAQPIPRILALWRTEGDLTVPPTMSSLLGDDVPQVAGKKIQLPPGRSNFAFQLTPSPHLFTGAWLARRFNFSPPLSAVFDFTKDSNARLVANAHYMLAIGGLDIFFNPTHLAEFDGTVHSLDDWLGMNWQTGGLSLAGATAVARAEMARREGYLLLSPERNPVDPAHPEAWVVAPNNYVAYTASIVGEAVRYLDRLIRQPYFLTPARHPISEFLGYLTYHRGPDKTPAVLASAMAAARRGTSAHAKKLQASMTAAGMAGLNASLEAVRTAPDTATAIAAANSDWVGILRPVIESGTTLADIENYIRNATQAEWPTYMDIRPNMLRFDRLLTYYQQLFA